MTTTPISPEKVRLSVTSATDERALQLSLDGQLAGPLPQKIDISPGRHLIEIRSRGLKPASQWISTPPGETRTDEIPLVRPWGPVTVMTSLANATISIDGAVVGRGSYCGFLQRELHFLTIEHEGYEPFSSTLAGYENRHMIHKISLKKK